MVDSMGQLAERTVRGVEDLAEILGIKAISPAGAVPRDVRSRLEKGRAHMVPPERGTRTRAGEAVKRPPEISFPRLMGQVLRTAIWRADKPTGKRPVLFFNGIGANLELVQPLGEKLDDRDIVTFDVPGVGESPDPDFPYRPWQMARLARKVLDYYGIDDVDVMGVSWGGGLAQQFAFQYRNRVGRVVLAATTTGFTMVPGKFEALSKMASPERYADPDFMRKNFEALYGDGEEHASGHASGLKPPSMKGYIFQMLAMAGWTSIPFLGQIKQPVLILAGDRDNIVPQINAKIIDTFLPNGRVHIVEGGGHLFLVSKADEVLPIIREFYDA